MPLNLNHTNKLNKNSIPYNLGELRKKPHDSDGKIHNFAQHFDPSYSYNNSKNLDRSNINDGIIKILTKTYPLKKLQNKRIAQKNLKRQTSLQNTENYKLT